MKYTVILALTAFTVGSVFAFSFSGVISRSLPEAYGIAMQTLGSRTNALVCVEGKRRSKKDDIGMWDFVFEGANASRVVVSVLDGATNGCIDCPHQ
jgi:hypothetical protein